MVSRVLSVCVLLAASLVVKAQVPVPVPEQTGICNNLVETLNAADCVELQSNSLVGFRLTPAPGSYLQYNGFSFDDNSQGTSLAAINVCILALFGNQPASIPFLPTADSNYDNGGLQVPHWFGRCQPIDNCPACTNGHVVSAGFDWNAFSTGNQCGGDTDQDGATEIVECFFAREDPLCYFDTPNDGNLEVLYPPLLDEANTEVTFTGTSAAMEVTIRVPRQYETAKFGFEDAADPSGGYDSEDPTPNPYWTVDENDACDVIYRASIPWDLFRTTLGGVTREDHMRSVSFSTTIDILTTKTLTLTPETLLEMREESGNHLLQAGTEYTRTVANKIPFEVTFETHIDLDSTVHVPSNHLRVQAALLDTSVLSVELEPVFAAEARLQFVTVLPLPLILDHVNISVDNMELQNGLAIRELTALQDCDVDQEFCTQHWEVDVYPEGCYLEGQFRADVQARCHDARQGCADSLLSPDTMHFLMDVTSDYFCGHSQNIELSGDLTLQPTDCNGFLRGRVTVENVAEGAYINRTDIVAVRAYPPLENPETTIVTVYDAGTSTLALQYVADTPAFNDEVNFEFEWRGSELRCDVVADVEVDVVVVYGATRDLSKKLLSFRSQGNQLLQVSGGESDSQSMIIGSSTRIGASNADGSGETGAAANASKMSGLMIGLFALAGVLVVLAIAGGLYVRRMRNKQRAAEMPHHRVEAAM